MNSFYSYLDIVRLTNGEMKEQCSLEKNNILKTFRFTLFIFKHEIT